MNNKGKHCLVTINIGNVFAEMGELTIPFMKKYADKVGADFVTIKKLNRTYASQYSAYWAKFELYDLFDDYDRIFYVDLDVLVYPHCPNMFEVVPEDKFGALMESDYNLNHAEEILEFQSRAGDINWRKEYFNVGVMVVSKEHREAFNIKNGSDGGEKYPEQTQINYNVQRFQMPIFKLDYRFNHSYFLGIDLNIRGDSFIVHYAGVTHRVRVVLIREDIKRYREGKPPVQSFELATILKKHFPGEDINKMFEEYKLLKDWEIGQ
jgi:lipopolysaccharide biosynthesis glycosyltransferase